MSSERGSDRGTIWLERALLLIGVACLSFYGFVTVGAAFYQREQAAIFERLRGAQQQQPVQDAPVKAKEPGTKVPRMEGETQEGTHPTADATEGTTIVLSDGAAVALPPATAIPTRPAPPIDARRPRKGDLLGMLDIPRLSISTPILAGDDRATLRAAAGHLSDTPRPWEPGNSAIAAHRDGLFRPLKKIRVGDEILVRTIHGDLRYRVRDTKVVMPDDLSVLNQTDTQTLTLITCYPFNFIGSAPKRFIVHADRFTNSPTATKPAEVVRQPVATGNMVAAAKSPSKPKTRRTTGRKAVSKASRAAQKATKSAPEEKLAVAERAPEKKSGNKFLRGLRAIGRAFKGGRAGGPKDAPPATSSHHH